MPLSPDPYSALRNAARYVQQFRRKTFVVKLGGAMLSDSRLRRAACEQIALLWTFSIRPVVVHGGGPELDALCDALHLPVHKVAGRRVTSAPVLDAAKMVLAGKLDYAQVGVCGNAIITPAKSMIVSSDCVWKRFRM